jgi:hypothetical protein
MMDECPHCGGKSGYREKLVVRYEQLYEFSGEPDGTTEYQHVSGGKLKYCSDCHKKIKCLRDKP